MSDSAALVLLPGSERAALSDIVPAGAIDPAERVELTVVPRRRVSLPRELVEGPATLNRAELAADYGAAQADVDVIGSVLGRYGLEVVSADPGARRMVVAGTVGAASSAFGATLTQVTSVDPVTSGQARHRHREGRLSVPAELDGLIAAVLGLDDRPQARSYVRRAAAATGQRSYTPPQLGTVYRFPAGTDGGGQVIAIIELGGGYTESDLQQYFRSLGVPAPKVRAVGVDGGANRPGDEADAEVLLDIEIAGALAPGAEIVVYFAPNTDRGFLDALTTAVHAEPTPTAVSISWGLAEDAWTEQGRTAMDRAMADAAALGVTVCVASGDWGSGDGQRDAAAHVDFPAASPNALACGGTTLDADPDSGAVASEVVWSSPDGSGTGGGVSAVFPLPSWQSGVDVPAPAGGGTGRGVPDVAAVADPATGYQVLINGRSTVVGGTSAVAPLMAALTCRLAQALGRRLGLLQPALYGPARAGEAAPGFRDVTSGSNGAYQARQGWDPCTGLGAALGEDVLALLRGDGGRQAGGEEPQAPPPVAPAAP